jgi:hypothetical protein
VIVADCPDAVVTAERVQKVRNETLELQLCADPRELDKVVNVGSGWGI